MDNFQALGKSCYRSGKEGSLGQPGLQSDGGWRREGLGGGSDGCFYDVEKAAEDRAVQVEGMA